MLIDFASTGVGLGMCDVAMLLAHSVSPTTLANGGQERLLATYLDALRAKGVVGYDTATATRHFHLATVDYARFVVSRFWGGASAAAFARRAANPNVWPSKSGRAGGAALCGARGRVAGGLGRGGRDVLLTRLPSEPGSQGGVWA